MESLNTSIFSLIANVQDVAKNGFFNHQLEWETLCCIK